MVQVAVPSRETDAHYERERQLLEQAVSEMNGEYGQVGSPVIHYLHQNLPFAELVALYLTADVMLVTPFRDGMKLVAKEYVMCRTDLTGRLVLSEFAGAAAELRGAFMVNPHDLEGVKEAIRLAVNAGPKRSEGSHDAHAAQDLPTRRLRLGEFLPPRPSTDGHVGNPQGGISLTPLRPIFCDGPPRTFSRALYARPSRTRWAFSDRELKGR